jgi:phosphatidylinositol glycan class H protein
MITTTPYLRTRRPSPTTVEYTVSTRPPPSLPLNLLLITFFTLRAILLFSTLLLLHSKWLSYPFASALHPSTRKPEFLTTENVWHTLALVHASRLGVAISRFAALVPLQLLLPVAAAILYATVRRIHTEESLLVLRGMGIQTSTSSGTYLSTATTRFIPTEKIQDIFVNEAFRGFEVRYYLVVVVEGEEEVVVVFPRLLPKRRIVEDVWRGCRECLYEPGRTAEKMVEEKVKRKMRKGATF